MSLRTRQPILLIVVAMVLLRPASAMASRPRPPSRPNVLFIAADDLRNDLACYGHPLAQTPHLDRLAARGVLFDRAYCQQALCNPSRASLLTGKRPDTLRIWDLPTHLREVQPDVVTLPQLFRNHGYFTQNIGKVFHNWRQKIQGDPDSWSVPAVMHFARHGDDVPQTEGPTPVSEIETLRTEKRDVPDNAYFDGRIADLAVGALRDRARAEQPFFLAVGFWKPHLPFNAPRRYWDLYDRSQITPADNSDKPADVPELALHNGRELLGANGRTLTRDEIIDLRHGYLAGISYMDAQIGRLLKELDQLGIAENTIIVFWSDHGFHLGEHSLWCKTSNFELDARVPLMIAAPGVSQRGARSMALVELLDLYPTLAELCELPPPADLDGRSLVPVLRDPQASVKDGACTQHPRPAYYKGTPEVMGVSVRTTRFRYTEWRQFETGEVLARELYDHATDGGETANVIRSLGDEAEARAARRLLHATFGTRGYSSR